MIDECTNYLYLTSITNDTRLARSRHKFLIITMLYGNEHNRKYIVQNVIT